MMKVFSVYDLKACAYLQPFFSGNAGSAIRAFEDAVGDAKSPIAKHPSDYQLFELGTWDDNSGAIAGILPMNLLCTGSDFIVAKPVYNKTVVDTPEGRLDEVVAMNGGSR